MDIVLDLIKSFIGLYIDVFVEYPLSAAFYTLLFVIAYFSWDKINEKLKIQPDAIWKNPAFILIIGWCITTPILGFIISIVKIVKNIISAIADLYIPLVKMYPLAGAIVTLILLMVYSIWKFIIKKLSQPPKSILKYPGPFLIVAWLVITPIVGIGLEQREKYSDKTGEMEIPLEKRVDRSSADDTNQLNINGDSNDK